MPDMIADDVRVVGGEVFTVLVDARDAVRSRPSFECA